VQLRGQGRVGGLLHRHLDEAGRALYLVSLVVSLAPLIAQASSTPRCTHVVALVAAGKQGRGRRRRSAPRRQRPRGSCLGGCARAPGGGSFLRWHPNIGQRAWHQIC
jgi:hypothetical protein